MKKTLLFVALLLAILGAPTLVGVAWAASVLNYFSQATASGDNVFNLNGTWKVDTTSVTATGTELNYTDVATAGTAEASKALVLDANKGATGLELVSAGQYRRENGATFTAADPNPSRATLRGASFFLVDTTANAVDLDFSDDADLEAADIGTEWIFIVSAGGTNALTVTNGASGVAVTTLNALGATCEDVNDVYRCVGTALEKVVCTTVCAD